MPGIDVERLDGLLRLSEEFESIESLWNDVKRVIYDLSDGRKCLGYRPNGCTTYFSKNFTEKDNERVQNWSKSNQIELYNTRCFKTVSNGDDDGGGGAKEKILYEIRLAGNGNGEIIKEDVNDDTDGCHVYRLIRGDYDRLMSRCAKYLRDAQSYVSNDLESEMLDCYVKSFEDCSLDMHKEGSRCWIKDKGPTVETYIGFIETYRDPAGVRGEFESFVAIVNREMTAKFTRLVDNAQKYLKLLPWTKDYEKDTFLKPDFTSLDVVAFAGSGIPAGINIPNCKSLNL